MLKARSKGGQALVGLGVERSFARAAFDQDITQQADDVRRYNADNDERRFKIEIAAWHEDRYASEHGEDKNMAQVGGVRCVAKHDEPMRRR
jgi:hypothetical protein